MLFNCIRIILRFYQNISCIFFYSESICHQNSENSFTSDFDPSHADVQSLKQIMEHIFK